MTPQQAMATAARHFADGRLPDAESVCRQILRSQPGFHPALYQLALIAVQVGKLEMAADLVSQATGFAPAEFTYRRTLCEIYRRLKKYDAAIAQGRQAIILASGDAESHYNLGIALADNGQYEAAADCYRQALACNRNHGQAANNLGAALEKLEDTKGAEEAYARAIAINPRHAEAQNNLGAILSARGDLKEARACFEAAIDAMPAFVYAHCNLSTVKKYGKDDPHIAILEGLLTQARSMPADQQIKFWFAIGKAWDDTGRYDEAFDAYHHGNSLKRSSFEYDESIFRRNVEEIIGRFDASVAGRQRGLGDPTPVFIVGMPRSGTTLIEQILSSHSRVHGAGELTDFSETVYEIAAQPIGSSYMDWLLKAKTADIERLGEWYVRKLKTHDPDALRIIDKMPGNFFFAGLIHLALPRAKIIHSVRDPMDTCVSNYMLLFNDTMPFAYDLRELGRYYRMYSQLMDHWKKVLPPGSILDVRYEDVVRDLEGQARRIAQFCGLEWEGSCLEFYKNRRFVKTASISQVRQPLYSSSVARWNKYEKWLKPLISELGDAIT